MPKSLKSESAQPNRGERGRFFSRSNTNKADEQHFLGHDYLKLVPRQMHAEHSKGYKGI